MKHLLRGAATSPISPLAGYLIAPYLGVALAAGVGLITSAAAQATGVAGSGVEEAGPATASLLRLDTPSGLPTPRFVSLASTKTNCRQGPSLGHPILFTFTQSGAPVLVIAESRDHWRKIRDAAGDECWAFHTTLRAQSHVMAEKEITVRRSRALDGEVRGRLGPGVLARVVKRREGWLLVEARGVRGWIEPHGLWGTDPLAAAARTGNVAAPN